MKLFFTLFPSIMYHNTSKYIIAVSFLYSMESTLYVFLPDSVVLPCGHGLDLFNM